jgi:UDP-N-acetyl-D-glucosamine dehydrogenase
MSAQEKATSLHLKTTSVLVIGLGYVGLPLAALINSKPDFRVTGFDLDQSKISAIQLHSAQWIDDTTRKQLHKNPLTVTSQQSALKTYDFILLCVPTPVNSHDLPDLELVLSATRTAATHIKPQGVIILESTVNPGVCEEVLTSLLLELGLTVGKDVYLAHCPERIDPGNSKFPLAKIPRILGADSPTGLTKAFNFYSRFLTAPIKKVSSLRTAEASKIVENAFRDINIAFVNELAQSFSHFDIDVVEVIEAASTKPFGFLAHYPGCGVGGHCIPVDPYYLIESAQHKGFEHRFLKLARQINRSMPRYTVELLLAEIKALGLDVKTTPVTLLGISYKGGIADQRNSPATEIRQLLMDVGCQLTVFDPFVPRESTVKTLEEALQKAEAVLIATNHQEFISAFEKDGENFPALKLIIDGRNCLRTWPRGVLYRGIGR